MGYDSGSQTDAFPPAAIMLTSRDCSAIGVTFYTCKQFDLSWIHQDRVVLKEEVFSGSLLVKSKFD